MVITADCQFQTFADAIKHLPVFEPLTKEILLTSQFLIQKEGALEMYYAPHNELINERAKVAIVGITPGWTQMEIAYREARQGIHENKPTEQILTDAKQAAGFAGSMRNYLVEMLDECGLAEGLQITSCKSLFNKRRDLLHTTSVIKHPVFYKGKNYTGHTPKIVKSPLLSDYAFHVFRCELEQINGALIVPLGKSVSTVLMALIEQGHVDRNHCLFGLPHPSGVNGHRRRQFAEEKESLRLQVINYFGRAFSHKKGG